MNNDKYIGLDVPRSSMVTAVHNLQSKCVVESIIETKAIRTHKRLDASRSEVKSRSTYNGCFNVLCIILARLLSLELYEVEVR